MIHMIIMIVIIDTLNLTAFYGLKNLKRRRQTETLNILIFWIIVYQKAQRSFILQLDPMFGMSGFTFKVMCLLSTPTGAKVIWQIELVVKNVRTHRQSVGNERFQEKVSPSLLQKAGDQKKNKNGSWQGCEQEIWWREKGNYTGFFNRNTRE